MAIKNGKKIGSTRSAPSGNGSKSSGSQLKVHKVVTPQEQLANSLQYQPGYVNEHKVRENKATVAGRPGVTDASSPLVKNGKVIGGTRNPPGTILDDGIPSTYEEIGEANLQADYDRANKTADELGLESTYSSTTDQFNDVIKGQREQKALQERQLELQRTQLSEGVAQEKKVIKGQVDAASGLVPSREGAVSKSNLSTYGKLKQAAETQVERLQRDYAVSDAAVVQAQKDLARAQRQGDFQLVQQYQQTLDAATSAAQQTETDYVNALSNQLSTESEYQKTQSAITQSGITTFQGLVEGGTEMDYNTVAGYASQLNLPTDLLMGYYQGAQSIRDDKTLSNEEKVIANAKNQQDLNDQISGIRTELDKNMASYVNLVKSGADADTIAAFKQMAGITDYNDPFTQAKLAYQQAQTAYQQSATAANYQDMLTAQAEYNDLYGSSSYLPTGGSYSVTQTVSADGSAAIKVGVVDGQSLDIPGTDRREDWCGAFVNDALGTSFGDLFTEKSAMINATIPASGMAFVQATSDQYGHVGIVESVNLATGEMTVVESNWQKGSDDKGIVGRRTMKIADAAGFVKPSGSVPSSGSQYSYDHYLEQAQSQGLSGKAAKDYATDMSTQAITGFKNTDQSKSYYQYSKMIPEDESYNSIVAGMDDSELEDYADQNGYFNSKLAAHSADEQLTATLVNELITDPTERQLFLNQARWVGAKLRGESGAAISVGEYLSEAQQFWPQAGDDAQTIKDKSAARKNVMNGLYTIMGPYGQKQIDDSKVPEVDQQAVQQEQQMQDLMELYDGSNILNEYDAVWGE